MRAYSRSHPMPPAPIRVLLADPHPLFRNGLERAIGRDPMLELALVVSAAEGLCATVTEVRPDVAVVDSELLHGAPSTCTADGGSARLLLLAGRLDPDQIFGAIQRGAAGCLSKDATADDVCRAIVTVASGGTLLDGSAQGVVGSEIRLRGRDDRPLLSPREREILVLIADGRTAPKIAGDLQLSTATVKTHILHLYEKLGVTERAAAVAEAMRRGLLE
jgi:two-component system nitrate/nitrite response regulator NarL